MLTKYILKEGRPTRPKRSFVFWGLISMILILLSTGFYFACEFLGVMKEAVNDFRLTFTFLANSYDYSGADFIKILVSTPVTALASLIGSINLIRMTNRKRFLSVLHILPSIGFVIFLLGAISYFIIPLRVFINIPWDYSILIPYWLYVGGTFVWAVGILIADIFALFYRHMNYGEFAPIYRSYRKALRNASTYSERSRIRYYFRYYWQHRRYDDMIKMLFGEKVEEESDAPMSKASYAYYKREALGHISAEREAQLDKLYETEQYRLLRKEIHSMTTDEVVKSPSFAKPKEEAKGETPETKTAKEEAPKTIEIDDGEVEELTPYGKKLVKKGRAKAMAQAKKAAIKERRRYERAQARACKGK